MPMLDLDAVLLSGSQLLDNRLPGQHLWAVAAGWRVDPAVLRDSGRLPLTTDTMISITGPYCLVCEQTYSPELADRPCPGDPNGWRERW